MEATLEVFWRERPVFSSRAHWLYPLFELERFLEDNLYNPAELTVRDKVVGRAAAFLLAKLKIGSLRAGVLSRPAREILGRAGIRCGWKVLVEKISCRTEVDLIRVDDPESAYLLLKRMAKDHLSGRRSTSASCR